MWHAESQVQEQHCSICGFKKNNNNNQKKVAKAKLSPALTSVQDQQAVMLHADGGLFKLALISKASHISSFDAVREM